MRFAPPLLVLCLCLGSPGLVMESDAVPSAHDETVAELDGELDTFISEAIEGGLLIPSGTSSEKLANPDFAEATAQRERAEASNRNRGNCGSHAALDFSAYSDFRGLDDVHRVRDWISKSNQERQALAKDVDVAKAHIALGLYSEARMELREDTSPDAVTIRTLSEMLEARRAPDLAHFRAVAACHSSAGLWLSVAKLIVGQDEAEGEFEAHLKGFRKLPLQLRTDIATLVVPRLTASGRSFLAEKIVADFSREEVAKSSSLQFSQALTKLAAGNTDAEPVVRSFLNTPQFQEAALAGLMSQDHPFKAMNDDVLIGDLIDRLARAERGNDLQSSLQFVLKELGSRSSYDAIIDLATLTAVQDSFAQSQIQQTIESTLERDLGSEDPMRSLAAMRLLESQPELVETNSQAPFLLGIAADQAARLGLNSLAQKMYEGSDSDLQLTLKIAELAFHHRDYAMVYAMAEQQPDNTALNVIAASSAINDQNPLMVDMFARRVISDSEAVLSLVEEDALSGRWILPISFYNVARRLDDPTAQTRFERIMSIKASARDVVAKNMTLSSVGTVLHRPVSALQTQNESN